MLNRRVCRCGQRVVAPARAFDHASRVTGLQAVRAGVAPRFNFVALLANRKRKDTLPRVSDAPGVGGIPRGMRVGRVARDMFLVVQQGGNGGSEHCGTVGLRIAGDELIKVAIEIAGVDAVPDDRGMAHESFQERNVGFRPGDFAFR